MAQVSGQSAFPLTQPISSSSSSPEPDALFSPTLIDSAITTPRVTPDRDSAQPGATGKSSQTLPVERVDARSENSRPEETQPQTQPTRFRPYPPEMYAPSVFAPPQAHPTVPYAYSGSVGSYQPSMVHPGMGMVPGQFSSPPHSVYAPQQHMSPYVPYPYAYSQPPYTAPAPQVTSPAVPYTFPLTQAGPAPVAPVNPPIAISADQVQAAVPTQASAPQTLAHQGPATQAAVAVAHPAQAADMVHAFPTADAAYFYNLGLRHSALGDVQPAINCAPQQQQYPQMQGYVPTDIYAAMGQQVVYSNAEGVQQAAPVSSSSVQSKRKRRMSDDGAANPKRKNPRPPVSTDADFTLVGEVDGTPIYECQRKQCKRLRMKVDSVYNHRRTKTHAGPEHSLLCTLCGEFLSRIDGLKRHVNSPRCIRNQKENMKKGLTPSGDTPRLQFAGPAPPVQFMYEAASPGPAPTFPQAPAPSAYAQMISPAAEPTVQKPAAASTVTQQQTQGSPPLPVFAVELSMQVTAQAPRPELPQQASSVPALPVFAHEFSLPAVHVTGQASKPQKAPGIPPPPVVAADFSISTPKIAEDEMDLFGSPEMTCVAFPTEVAVQEDTTDAVASIPGFDASAYDISFDDWMNETEQAAPAVFADPTMNFSEFFGN